MSDGIVNNSSTGFLLAPAGRTFRKENREDAMKIVLAVIVILFALSIGIVVVILQIINILKNVDRDRG